MGHGDRAGPGCGHEEDRDCAGDTHLLEILNCFGVRAGSNSLDASLSLLECNCNAVWDFGLMMFAVVWGFLRVQLGKGKHGLHGKALLASMAVAERSTGALDKIIRQYGVSRAYIKCKYIRYLLKVHKDDCTCTGTHCVYVYYRGVFFKNREVPGRYTSTIY